MNLQKTKILECFLKVFLFNRLVSSRVSRMDSVQGIKFRPYKVRVTNVTDSALQCLGLQIVQCQVLFTMREGLLPGPLAWLGKKKAVMTEIFRCTERVC